MSPFSRKTLLSIRILNLLISIPSLALFSVFFGRLTTYYETHLLAVSAFPIIGLGVTIIWNILAIILALIRTNISRNVYLSFDLTTSVILILFGTYGSWNNANYYLSAYSWEWNFTVEEGRDWFGEQIAAILLIGVTAGLQILITILSFWGRGVNTRVDRGCIQPALPTYDESVETTEENFEDESVASFESISKEKKDKSAESYA